MKLVHKDTKIVAVFCVVDDSNALEHLPSITHEITINKSIANVQNGGNRFSTENWNAIFGDIVNDVISIERDGLEVLPQRTG